MESAFTAYFVTLTFNDEFYQKYPKLDKSVFQRFLKRLRQYDLRGMPNTYQGKKVFKIDSKGANFRYFACGEYGEKNKRPHWHMIIFNFPYDHEMSEIIIAHAWQEDGKSLGFDKVTNVKQGAIEYVTGYMFKNKDSESFQYMSKGLGSGYVNSRNTHYHQKSLDGLVRVNNEFRTVPRYLGKLIYTDKQRQFIGEKKMDIILDQIEKDPLLIQKQLNTLEQKVKFKKSKR